MPSTKATPLSAMPKCKPDSSPSVAVGEVTDVADPWATCFLTSMIIRFLDGLQPAPAEVDYQRIIGAAEGFDHIHDPRGFLLDPNNWVPGSLFISTPFAASFTTPA